MSHQISRLSPLAAFFLIITSCVHSRGAHTPQPNSLRTLPSIGPPVANTVAASVTPPEDQGSAAARAAFEVMTQGNILHDPALDSVAAVVGNVYAVYATDAVTAPLPDEDFLQWLYKAADVRDTPGPVSVLIVPENAENLLTEHMQRLAAAIPRSRQRLSFGVMRFNMLGNIVQAIAIGSRQSSVTLAGGEPEPPLPPKIDVRQVRDPTRPPTAALGQEPTLSEASKNDKPLIRKKLTFMNPIIFGLKNKAKRKGWFLWKLGPYENQMRESAIEQRIPVQLLAAVMLAELIDISPIDILQEQVPVGSGSFGYAQIQVDTVLNHGLFPNFAPTNPMAGMAFFKIEIAHALMIPQYAISAAAREIRLLLDRMKGNPAKRWQTDNGYRNVFSPDEINASSNSQIIYENSFFKNQEDREKFLARAVAGAYNSPDIIITSDPNTFTNGVGHGDNALVIAEELLEFGIFRP
jgi:hypothetical protein